MRIARKSEREREMYERGREKREDERDVGGKVRVVRRRRSSKRFKAY